MTAGWVAAAVRGRAIIDRLVGAEGARELAMMDSWAEARAELARTAYGVDLPADADRNTARRHVCRASLWQLRVLTGWLPAGQSLMPRLFAAPFEIANIEAHLRALGRGGAVEPYDLGALAVAWPAVSKTTTADDVRRVLALSVWGDPGESRLHDVALALRIGLARRAAAHLPIARDWAAGTAAVIVARETLTFDRPLNDATVRSVDRLIGRRWRRVATPAEFSAALPADASWPLVGIDDEHDIWRAELAVAGRIAADAQGFATGNRYVDRTVMGMMALLLVDAWRVLAAIEVAGLHPVPQEVFDAVA